MWLLEQGNEILVLDCGVMFPDEEMLGVDLVIPDISYLKERENRVKAILLSHGHEDHIGALPYILRQLNVPVYGTRLTLGLVEAKLEEHGLKGDVRLHEIKAGDVIKLGPFPWSLSTSTTPSPTSSPWPSPLRRASSCMRPTLNLTTRRSMEK